jgi:hypothetical protein
LRVSTSPAAVAASRRVLKVPAPAAVSTISFIAGAMDGAGVAGAGVGEAAEQADTTRAKAATESRIVRFMWFLWEWWRDSACVGGFRAI